MLMRSAIKASRGVASYTELEVWSQNDTAISASSYKNFVLFFPYSYLLCMGLEEHLSVIIAIIIAIFKASYVAIYKKP